MFTTIFTSIACVAETAAKLVPGPYERLIPIRDVVITITPLHPVPEWLAEDVRKLLSIVVTDSHDIDMITSPSNRNYDIRSSYTTGAREDLDTPKLEAPAETPPQSATEARTGRSKAMARGSAVKREESPQEREIRLAKRRAADAARKAKAKEKVV